MIFMVWLMLAVLSVVAVGSPPHTRGKRFLTMCCTCKIPEMHSLSPVG